MLHPLLCKVPALLTLSHQLPITSLHPHLLEEAVAYAQESFNKFKGTWPIKHWMLELYFNSFLCQKIKMD